MKITVYFMNRPPVELEAVDRLTVEHGGAVYRFTAQRDALGARLDHPLGDQLVVLPHASNGADLMHTPHDVARTTTKKARRR